MESSRNSAFSIKHFPCFLHANVNFAGSCREKEKKHFKKIGELQEMRETPPPEHDIQSLVDKEDKAIVHDHELQADQPGMPYSE